VLQQQGLKDRTLGERGSLWCCLSKASCSLLHPGKQLAQRQVKSRQEGLKRESIAKARLFHQNPKRKTALGVDNLGLGRPLPLEAKGMASLREEDKKSVAMARPSSSSSMAKRFFYPGT
jgi:hypothetical protein